MTESLNDFVSAPELNYEGISSLKFSHAFRDIPSKFVYQNFHCTRYSLVIGGLW